MTKTILLFGPTASGKTELSIELAKKIDAEIISADSMQVYRGMDIGTAKPAAEQRNKIPHHLIDVVDPDEEWTVSSFISETEKLISEIQSRKKTAIIVGGTGLYLNAFINGFSFPIAAKDDSIRAKLSSYETKELYEKLLSVDPAAAEKIDKNDKKRIIRALEVFESTGIPISQLQKKDVRKDIQLFCLDLDREALYSRINERVDKMFAEGLVDEVKGLLGKGYSKALNSMQALGYKETIAHLEEKLSLQEASELIKKGTRNFAKRQLTWFRRFPDVKWIDASAKNGAEVIFSLLQ